MSLSSRHSLSIVEIVFYTPTIFIAIFICRRHGFNPKFGWLFLVLFSFIRIAGAALDLATINAPSSALILSEIAIILSFVGLGQLLLATLGLLDRVRLNITKSLASRIKPLHVLILRFLDVVGLILCARGSAASGASLVEKGVYPALVLTKVGLIILLVVFVAILVIAKILFRLRSYAVFDERRLLYAIGASLVFILTRILYSVLGVFTTDKPFLPYDGSVAVLWCMATLTEVIVVTIYATLGVTLPPIPAEDLAKEERHCFVRPCKLSKQRIAPKDAAGSDDLEQAK